MTTGSKSKYNTYYSILWNWNTHHVVDIIIEDNYINQCYGMEYIGFNFDLLAIN